MLKFGAKRSFKYRILLEDHTHTRTHTEGECVREMAGGDRKARSSCGGGWEQRKMENGKWKMEYDQGAGLEFEDLRLSSTSFTQGRG